MLERPTVHCCSCKLIYFFCLKSDQSLFGSIANPFIYNGFDDIGGKLLLLIIGLCKLFCGLELMLEF